MDISSVGDRSCNPITLFTANPDGSGEVVKVVNGHYSRAYSHPQRVFATIEQMRVLSSSVLVP